MSDIKYEAMWIMCNLTVGSSKVCGELVNPKYEFLK